MENEFKAALDAGKKVAVKIEVGFHLGVVSGRASLRLLP
jgi:hypothetical protein